MELDQNEKYKRLFLCLDRWMVQREKGHRVIDYLEKCDIHTVAIYGMGRMGRCLFRELETSGMKVEYILDQRKLDNKLDVKQIPIDDKIPEVDAIIVTAIAEFYEIEKTICARTKNMVISLETIISELERMDS